MGPCFFSIRIVGKCEGPKGDSDPFPLLFPPEIQGVPLPFHLFQTSVSSRIFDLEQKFLHQYAAYGCTFYMTKIVKIGRLVEF